MKDQTEGYTNDGNEIWGFITGLFIGGAVGAGAMLLMAPQSGRRTRAQIKRQSEELRDQASETIDDVLTQARLKTHQIKANVRGQAEDLHQRGQDLYDGQKERLLSAVDTGIKKVQGINSKAS